MSLIWGLKRALNNMSKVMEGAVGMGLLEFALSMDLAVSGVVLWYSSKAMYLLYKPG